jgi:hypothetical protein
LLSDAIIQEPPAKYEDIRPIDMEEEVEKYKASIDMQERIKIQKKLQQRKRVRLISLKVKEYDSLN